MDLKIFILPEAAVLVTGLRSGGIFISDKIGILTCWATLHVPCQVSFLWNLFYIILIIRWWKLLFLSVEPETSWSYTMTENISKSDKKLFKVIFTEINQDVSLSHNINPNLSNTLQSIGLILLIRSHDLVNYLFVGVPAVPLWYWVYQPTPCMFLFRVREIRPRRQWGSFSNN